MDLDDAGQRFGFLNRDRDARFSAAFDTVLTATGMIIIKTQFGRRGRTPSPSASSARSAAIRSTAC